MVTDLTEEMRAVVLMVMLLLVLPGLLNTSDTVAESCAITYLVATASYGSIIYSGSGGSDHCAWIIQGATDGEVIGMRVTDWFTPSGFTCSAGRLVIRDGPDLASPYLRVLCGAMCGVLNNVTEVVTSSNAARVAYLSAEFSSTQPRGFTLLYRSRPPKSVGRRAAMYTGINYVLMCVSVLVIGGLLGGIVFLYYRELALVRQQKKQHMIQALKKRRQAFSGQSGAQSRADSEEEECQDTEEGEGPGGLVQDTDRTHVPNDTGAVTSPALAPDVTLDEAEGEVTTSQTANRTHVQRDEDSTSQTVLVDGVVAP